MAEGSSEKMSSETTEDEPFTTVPVRRKRKRGQVEDMDTSEELKRPSFPPAKAEKLMVSFSVSSTNYASSSALHVVDPLSSQGGKSEMRKIPVPPHRYTPLKENWMKIFTPIVEQLKLQIRFNLNARKVEIRVRLLATFLPFITVVQIV